MLVGFLSGQEQDVPAIPWESPTSMGRAWEAALEQGRLPTPWGYVQDQILAV